MELLIKKEYLVFSHYINQHRSAFILNVSSNYEHNRSNHILNTMKKTNTVKLLVALITLLPSLAFGQFDFYGPQQFGDILNNSYNPPWTPSNLSAISNLKYMIIVDQATQTQAVMLNTTDNGILEINSIDSVNGTSSTYGSLMRSVFQMVDSSSHYENDIGAGSGTYAPMSEKYTLNSLLHSFFSINSDGTNSAISSDAGSFYIHEDSNGGYLLIEFGGTSASTTIRATSQWDYNVGLDSIIENTGWTAKYLMISGNSLSWTTSIGSATDFTLLDATDLIDIEIAAASEFNPVSLSYQTNATAALPAVDSMANSTIITRISNDMDASYTGQLGNLAGATTAATTMLNTIETNLISTGDSLRYPKQFYLDLRENMLTHKVASSDVFNARLGNNTIEHVYFTNASDDNGVPHPFMVVAAHAVSSRPNFLADVNRPPGALPGVGYAQSTVTRHGKLGEFLFKIPLKDYGLISSLLDNDLSAIGDLASEYDAMFSATTVKDVYNYAPTASTGIAVDGVTLYPAKNNNLRFAVVDAEVTSSGIHVGGGLELHYHADGHAYNGNGFNLYNISDYSGHDHPPVIGAGHDGIALFGKYEVSFSSMAGYGVALDAYGGHDHGDIFGYHYHAHTLNVIAAESPFPSFDEHFLMVGAWKGNIDSIPGLTEVKMNQFSDPLIDRYVGASYTPVGVNEAEDINNNALVYPNPTKNNITIEVKDAFTITVTNFKGQIVQNFNIKSGKTTISLDDYSNGVYFIEGLNTNNSFVKKIVKN